VADLHRKAEELMARCRLVAACTDTPGEITRLFCGPGIAKANALVSGWMETAGMQVWMDAAGNLRGLYGPAESPRLLIASHLDTVPNAGAFDGVLGVLMGISLVELLGSRAAPLPYSIEVIAFSEEEGVRFRAPFLGSLALIGKLDEAKLALRDASGKTARQALEEFRAASDQSPASEGLTLEEALVQAVAVPQSFAYFEIHIEQGPVLEAERLAVSAVSGIVGQSRVALRFVGRANHAGTTPMRMRQDALASAAEFTVEVEKLARVTDGLVATVGRMETPGGTGNVVAGEALATLDVRHADDAVRVRAVNTLCSTALRCAESRDVQVKTTITMEQCAVPMNERLTNMLTEAARRVGYEAPVMTSGAGHDAMVVAPTLPATMLFVRSPGGLSHHPEEEVLLQDLEAGLIVAQSFLDVLASDYAGAGARHG
jgi:allantoate deiminase